MRHHQSALYMLIHLTLPTDAELYIINFLVLQMRKLQHRETESLAQSHRAWESQDLNVSSRFHALTHREHCRPFVRSVHGEGAALARTLDPWCCIPSGHRAHTQRRNLQSQSTGSTCNDSTQRGLFVSANAPHGSAADRVQSVGTRPRPGLTF